MDNVEVDGLEALCCAPRDGALEIVEMLLDAKVNVEGDLVDWLNPVELAASNGHCEVLRVLLVAGCRLMYDGQILRQAARFGDIELVVWVVREGVEWMVPDLEDALVCAVIENRAEVVQILLAAGASAQGALCTAVSNGNEEMVWLLLSEGADVDWNNGEALCTAAQYERLDIAKVLLKAAADIHVGNDNTLRRGAREARLEVVKFLLALGANPYTFSVQELLSFARDFHVEVVDVLMEARGEGDCLSLLLANNLSFCTEWGPLWDEPPLRHMAAGKRGTELFKVLLNGHLGAVHKAVRSAQKKGRGNVVLQWAADARLDDRGKSRLVNSNIFGGNLGLM
ncbi:hypothetical protein HK104_004638 [Borealophlyctis nickersoniae]|nr:hypothetical protein HK104_004638 [Borealophlyctis nickersoniae]